MIAVTRNSFVMILILTYPRDNLAQPSTEALRKTLIELHAGARHRFDGAEIRPAQLCLRAAELLVEGAAKQQSSNAARGQPQYSVSL